MMAAIDGRWISEHGFTDNPLWNQLDAVLATLVGFPNSGDRWHVYYTYDAGRALITILAVWYASRGSRPAF